jgi:hypothetical protein
MKLGIGTRVNHPTYGEGVVCSSRFSHHNISFLGKGMTEIDKSYEGLEIIEYADEDGRVAVEDVREVIAELFDKAGILNKPIAMGDRWKKGVMILKPYDDSLSPKEIPVEDFFHKIVMLRDRMRVLEQKINANPKLEESEKVDMQQYITRCYGSLTTFNVLFKYKEDQFVGQKGE